jgi:hypothetical protein
LPGLQGDVPMTGGQLMSPSEWTDEAMKCSSWLVRDKSFRERAVGASVHDGYCVVFAPLSDKGRIDKELAAAGIKILGTGKSKGPNGNDFFASIVETTDDELLRKIVRA